MVSAFEFIDNNAGIDRSTRRRIRSHASRGHRVGKPRPSRQRDLNRPVKTLLLLKGSEGAEDYDLEEATPESSLTHQALASSIQPFIGDFVIFPAELSSRSHHHLRSFLYQLPGSMFAVKLGFPIDTRSVYDSIWVRSMFLNEAYFHCSVAVAITLIEPTEIRPQNLTDILYHMARSLQIVKEKLSSEEALNDSTLATIISLTQFDRVQGRYEQGIVHFEGLLRMTLLRGGVSGFLRNPAILQKIFRADLEFALYFGSPTRLRAEDLLGQNTVAWFRKLFKKNAMNYFCGFDMFKTLHPGFQSVCLDVLSFSWAVNSHEGHASKLGMESLHNVIILLIYRLIDISHTMRHVGETQMSRVLKLGMLAYMTNFLTKFLRKVPQFRALNLACRSLWQGRFDGDQICQSIALWFLLMTGISLFDSQTYELLLPKIMDITQSLKLDSWDDVEERVSQFPWVTGLHSVPAKSLWDKSQSARLGLIK
ncbi:hypothetical protein BX600DRAFT_515884 [Xylariales sp. PMI_506]|nr:hypothetical protein BX600DRAFT_515884 [Xylariales sp. PMI_506]